MANYELYWNTPDCKKVSTDMVISGSFNLIDDARAYAYSCIKYRPKMVIEIFDIGYSGDIKYVGVVKISGSKVFWEGASPAITTSFGPKPKYLLKKNGKISRL